MLKKFTKMHGAGNDYIYFNCLREEFTNIEDVAIRLSDRHKGIGGDGIVLICKSTVADAKMRMFNADGSEGKMCGNAIRCVGKYLYDNNIIQKTDICIETLSGIKELKLFLDRQNRIESVQVNMGCARFHKKEIPVNIKEERIINYPITVDGKVYRITCLSVGNPHCVIFTDPRAVDIAKIGPLFENNAIFPERINTEFAIQLNDNTFAMRVWERGSGETMACGTGACAVVAAAVANGLMDKNQVVTVKLLGGDLTIYIDKRTDAIYMTGETRTVFEGEVEL